ncbi:hypothetical protein BSY18_1782 [Blastomonas sp. RAC04]|uniref:hypothetical protein n=1 Tax=Blastomonas sp. RAC04 TaxID=1842535 RepID=UPI00083DE565|nr:hypothetical protein [Blastomonas sp. RAC04]AOG01724.1 hypothetical protein BSY18_1782 [Blastomonas sp. RAC04]
MLKALTGLGAAGAMMVTGLAPAMAAPVSTSSGAGGYSALADLAWDQRDEQAGQWRGGWGNRGWGNRGWRGRNRGIDGGDILAGALILGGIAAIASAATNSSRNRNGPNDRYSYNDDVRSASTQCGAAAAAQSGFGARVERIDNVVRDGNGWRVEGLVGSRNTGVDSFTCGISYGRIDYVRFNRANGAWGAGDVGADSQVFGDAGDPAYVPPQGGDDDFAYRNDADPYPPE